MCHLRICFAASSGGHFEQLMRLRPLMDQYDSFIITEKLDYVFNIEGMDVFFLEQLNRTDNFFICKLIVNFAKTLKLIMRQKPDVLITTGALVSIPLIILMHFGRKKVIFIESFAKVSSPTATGKIAYKLADRFYVQWEAMKKYYPSAICLGGIY